MRKFTEDTLVLATHNKGKIHEFEGLLAPYIGAFSSSLELGLTEPEETGATFTENAIIKALSAANESGKPALADDSGLAVYALNGDPGIDSARWAGPEKDFDMAMEKIHTMMGDTNDRRAAFVAVLALAWPDGHTETFEGRAEGTIIWPPRGDAGFGYDPFFLPDGHDKTFAEMTREEKQKISHRANAFKKLQSELFA